MSAEDSLIAVSNETSEPGPVDSPTIPPSEHLTVKDVSTVPDFPPPESVTEPPADAVQTASDDTLSNLPKLDVNIPNATPTNLNGSANGVEATTFVSVELLNLLFFLRHPLERMMSPSPFDTVFTC
jgi:hypothetical protein